MKILILKPSSLGDVIQALPVLRLLKRHQPKSEIYWWLDANLVPLLDGDPDLAGIFPFQRKRWASAHRWPEIATSIRTMRAMKFDYAIDLQGLARSALFAWLSNADVLIGLDNPREGGREGARAFYDLTPPRCAPGTHAVDRYAAVLPLLNVPIAWDFEWLPRRATVAAAVQSKWPIANEQWVLLVPGARWENKLWPVEHFAATVKLLAKDTNLKFAVLGSGDDKQLGKTISSAVPGRVLDLTGQTSLHEMIEWLRLSRLVIANDTGPMHIAAALGKPTIALFGPTDPKSAGPFRQLDKVLQSDSPSCIPCLKGRCSYPERIACLKAITPELVAAKANQLLDY
ncbi:MAG: lipopolysaccharide heptosyltransferase II [Limisphaerales bacterium]